MKYALLDNNTIKVGPREYTPSFFEKYLKTKDVEFTFPLTKNDNEPIVINEDISLVPVEDPSMPSLLPVTEQLAGPYWNITPELITGYYDVVDVPIDAAKNKIKSLVADERYKKETSSVKVTIQETEVTVSVNRGSDREVWYQTLSTMGDEDTRLFKFPVENVWISLSKNDVRNIITSIVEHVQEAFVWENEMVGVINSSEKDGINTLYEELFKKEEENPFERGIDV